ncbi:MAG: hypothetical protein KJP05_09090, partial [Deltaproteobacteria bacterium]|nr:hypothetical protein [Deltaproteobacteria bacterium]
SLVYALCLMPCALSLLHRIALSPRHSAMLHALCPMLYAQNHHFGPVLALVSGSIVTASELA